MILTMKLMKHNLKKAVNKDSFYEQEHLFVDKMSLRNFYKAPNTNDADSEKIYGMVSKLR